MSTTGNGLMSMMSEAASHCSTSKVLFINTALPWSVLLLSASLLAQRGEEIQGVVPESSALESVPGAPLQVHVVVLLEPPQSAQGASK